MDIRALHEDNRRAWSEAAEVYATENDEVVEYIRSGKANFCPPELPFLEGLGSWCRRAIHLQCAGGRDTLSLLNMGAKEVVGVDISDRMIEVAQYRSDALGAPAKWYRCDLLDTPDELNETADLVYTGRGALCWNMDIEAWARVVARLLKPGGKLFVFEGHPVTWLFDMNSSTLAFDPNPPFGYYFAEEYATDKGWPSTYVGDVLTDASKTADKHERQWNLGQVVNAVIDAGLVIKRLGEYPDPYWDMYPLWSAEDQSRIPQTFALLAEKPAQT